MAYLRGEPKVWSVVRVPSVAEEDDRRLHRERDRLINERVQHVNRIKGLCAVHGIYDYEPLRPNRLARLEQLRAADGCELPPRFIRLKSVGPQIGTTLVGATGMETSCRYRVCPGT
jgi:transposase